MDAARTADPAGQTGRAPAHDKDGWGDERHPLFAAYRLPWRYLPRDGFPPRSTVYNIFRNFQRAGVWDRIWEHLHGELREHMAHEASPTASIIASQSLKSAEKGAVISCPSSEFLGQGAA
jgi:transposase